MIDVLIISKNFIVVIFLKGFTSCLNVRERFLAHVSYILPVAFLYLVGWEELGAHTYAEHASLEPCRKVLFRRSNTASDHDLSPRHRCHEVLHHCWTIDIAREEFGEVATELLCCTHFAYRATAWAVGDETAVVDMCNTKQAPN